MPHFSPVSEDSFMEPACQALTQEKGSDPVELTPDKEAGSPSYSLPLDFWSQPLLYAGPGGYALVARIYELKYKQRMKALPGWHNMAAVPSSQCYHFLHQNNDTCSTSIASAIQSVNHMHERSCTLIIHALRKSRRDGGIYGQTDPSAISL
ncbi:hypothetical protein V1508DRAFT_430718 [Lipomyces doorenjongii]|uniref:uncharacterized protein n=1 Tax=Lipomyces doorenjongii TaxID=383834 RepID=UPI0034CF8A3B